jgi:hypothetical protein
VAGICLCPRLFPPCPGFDVGGQEFDVPVIHVVRTVSENGGDAESRVQKLMHRFRAEDVVRVIDRVLREEGQ